ncbi:MAG: universal stress protein [Synechococcus sp.]
MNKLLLCTDGSAFSQVSYEYVAWLAQRIPLEIDVLYVTDVRKERAIPTHDFSGSLGIDSYQELLDRLVELEREVAKIEHQRAKTILQTAQAFFIERGIPESAIKLVHETGFLVDCFDKWEASCDLIVLGKRGETASFATEHLGSNVERIVRASHKPCLVTPREFRPISSLLFAYDGGSSCQKALNFLVDSPLYKGLTLHLVTVAKGQNKQAAEQLLSSAAQTLTAAGYEPTCNILQGNPEDAILNYVDTHNVDSLLMGAYGHNRIRRLLIGSTTTQVLMRSHLPVMLYR